MVSQDWVGNTIGGRYQIEALLGQGGMSAVYRAYDPNLRRSVAIKLIHPHLSTDPNFIGRFKEEAAAIARLRHPNIVQVYDFDIDGETYYMVMEYTVGETLLARLKRLSSTGRKMSFSEAVNICLQICDAAGYAHDHELIHRDIKPANIMLDVNAQAILMDFGIVKIIGGEYHTSTGATVGTAMYMSPEQIRGERIDDCSDIYSLGVTLYEMVAGRPPYQADSSVTLMMMVLNDPLPDIRRFRGDVPEKLLSVIDQALEKVRTKRYQSMSEMAAALQQLQGRLENALPTITVVENKQSEPVTSSAASSPRAENVTLPETRHGGTQQAVSQENLLCDKTLPGNDGKVSAGSSGQAFHVEPVAPTSENALRKIRKTIRFDFRHLIIPAIGVILLLAAIIAGYLYFSSKKPPDLVLAPITSSALPINAATAKNIVSMGSWDIGSYATDLAFSPDGMLLATANNRDWVRFTRYHFYAGLWQFDTSSLKQYLFGQEGWLNIVVFSPDGKLLATASDDGSLCLWSMPDGKLVRKLEPGFGEIKSADFSPNNLLLTASTWEGYIGLWEISNGNLLRTIKNENRGFKDVKFSPDGSTLAAGLDDGTIQLWSVSNGSLLLSLEGHTAAVYKVAFSPDGRTLASASEDLSIMLWTLQDGAPLNTLQGHSQLVTDVSFSHDGSLLASGSEDGTVRLWRTADGEVLSILPQDEGILSVAFSPDSHYLASSGWGNLIYFWGISEAIPIEVTSTPAAP